MTAATNKLATNTSLELFPDMLPDTSTMYKEWVWKEETNTLEQISTGLQVSTDRQMINLTKAKKTNKVMIQHTNNTTKKKKTVKQPKASTVMSPRLSSLKLHSSEIRSITLHDVQVVALDILMESGSDVPESFQESLRKNDFDGLLVVLLQYFETFFDRIAIENKPKTMATEASVAEKKATLVVIRRQELIKKLMAEKYSTLILGMESESQHHMACGRQRKSDTKKDRTFYETLYSYFCFVVWVTFRRNGLDKIQEELGRLFRGSAFNPYGRPADNDSFKLASDLTEEEIHNIRLTPSSIKKNKRPPIKSIVNQRSPVIVALLPNSKESAAWLLDRRKALTLHSIKKNAEEDAVERVDVEDTCVGIIGEMICGFNPFTLAPFGEDSEEKEEHGVEKKGRTK